jgi:hypothetical protein
LLLGIGGGKVPVVATRILLHALTWACLLWSAAMLGATNHHGLPDTLGEAGSALPAP